MPSDGLNPLLATMVSQRGQLIALAHRIVSNRDLAEDVVHDATLKVCGMGGACAEFPKRFACRRVRNLAVDCLRQRKCEGRLRAGCPLEAADVGFERAYVAREDLERISSVLAGLPKATSEAFLRHRLNGESQRSIALAMGLSTSRVNDMIRAADRCCRCAVGEPPPSRPAA